MSEYIPGEKRKFDVKSFNRWVDSSVPLLVKGVARTKQRLFIYSIFQKTDTPLTAEDILCISKENNKNINQATVYRTLLEFRKNKLIEKTGKISTIVGNKRACYRIL